MSVAPARRPGPPPDGPAPEGPARASYRSVFAVREFRVMFTAMLTLSLGFEFEILGLSVLVYARTGSALLAAVAFGAGFAPQALSGILLTSLADRLPPRPAISAGLLGRAVPGLAIGAAAAMPVAVMLALVAVTALGTPVFLAASSGLLPEILDGDAYPLGRSVLSMTNAGTQILGLGLGGALLTVLSPRWLLACAGLALTVAALVVRLGLRRRPARTATGTAAGRGAVRPACWPGCGKRCTRRRTATGPCSPARACGTCCSSSGCPRGSPPGPRAWWCPMPRQPGTQPVRASC
jgi:MFS family permease